MKKTMQSLVRIAALFFVTAAIAVSADQLFLRRNLAEIQPVPDDLTRNAQGASYKPIFGMGDKDADKLIGVARYGELTVLPGGASAVVSYPAEEQIYYVLEGSGTLIYQDQRMPIKKDDFMYLPVNVPHGILNQTNGPIRVLVMGFEIPPGKEVPSTPKLMISTSTDVELQVLAGHGPTTKFKLLMGTTKSTRDRLAAATQMTSLFIMQFEPGGTNIPHSHPREEEIYLLLRGQGEMVAGVTPEGQDARHPAREGDAFYFAPGTRVGYYSGAKEGEPPDLILAVRSMLPAGEGAPSTQAPR